MADVAVYKTGVSTQSTIASDTEANSIAGLKLLGEGLTSNVHRTDENGNEWILIFNDSGATINQGEGVSQAAYSSTGRTGIIDVAKSTTNDVPLGIAQADIATLTFAWVLKKGIGEVRAGANITAFFSGLSCTTAGEFIVTTTSLVSLDINSLESGTIADDALATCMISL